MDGLIRMLLTGGFLFVLYAAARQDLTYYEIEEECWIACVILGLYTALLNWLGQETGFDMSLGSRLVGAVTASLPFLLLTLWRLDAFGGGDIKLQAAIGLFLGWPKAGWALVLAVYAAGAYAFLLLARRDGRREFALGPFLCGGAALSLLF